MKSYIADTCAWVDYFNEKEGLKPLLEENAIKTPTIVVTEITRVLRKKKSPPEKIRYCLKFIFKHSIILPLDFDQAVKAGEISSQEKMHLGDAVVYSYASQENEVLTTDHHFKGKPFVELIE
ncbi:MAG TPA: PIN domain-containing protein [Candidatus Norongarragalinales archaeon]|nr:PIN domain-containing protein [Candidatus Norongarragalinales archaeon]